MRRINKEPPVKNSKVNSKILDTPICLLFWREIWENSNEKSDQFEKDSPIINELIIPWVKKVIKEVDNCDMH